MAGQRRCPQAVEEDDHRAADEILVYDMQPPLWLWHTSPPAKSLAQDQYH
jgi:hypothetical protein